MQPGFGLRLSGFGYFVPASPKPASRSLEPKKKGGHFWPPFFGLFGEAV
jgi:hypothetical protein